MMRKAKSGDFWILDPDSHLSKWAELHGRLDHDQNVLPIILKHIPAGGVVVDCGAYIGTMSWAFINQVGYEGAVYSIEPNPVAFECLERNCPSATCLNVGLWDSLKKAKLVPPSDYNYGATSVDPLSPGDVDLICLDSLGLPRLDFLKVDIEGCECQALKGAEKTIERCKPVMLIEVNEGCLKAHGRSGKELLLLIHDLGYNMRNVFGEQPMEGPQWDALCFPNKKR